ncbi:MAG: RHS repeat protein, partial [Gammaproteobacteria bacterium]|nr:RHS repeat protein [Gammaproteobacteria bacterium]
MFKYPFTLIASDGLGASYSSLDQIGELLPSRTMGQAGVKAYANAANGNLVVVDHMVTAMELNAQLNLGFVYNSQSTGNPWHFSIRSLTGIPPFHTSGAIGVIEEDGHESVYIYDTGFGAYIAPANGKARAQITYNDSRGVWQRHDLETGCIEEYNANGNLVNRIDAKGNASHYTYDSQNRIRSITSPTGTVYQFSYDLCPQGTQVSIIMVENGTQTVLQRSIFDPENKLLSTTIGDSYTISYIYQGGFLYGMNQTDGTQFNFEISRENSAYYLTRIFAGYPSYSSFSFDYSQQPVVTITDSADAQKNTITLDDKQCITQFKRETGDVTPVGDGDLTTYSYYDSGLLEDIKHPDGGVEKLQYDAIGAVQFHQYPDRQATHFLRDQQTGVLTSEIKDLLDGATIINFYTTRYVYDTNFDSNGHRVLRFAIDPKGGVIEYRCDTTGYPTSKRIYLNAIYDISTLGSDQVPSLTDMTNWVALQDPQQISLTEYQYNSRGQITETRIYSDIDPDGKGISNAAMAKTNVSWNYAGNWLTKVVKQTEGQDTTYTQYYDALQRLTSKEEAVNATEARMTFYDYDDASRTLTITKPNGRTEKITYNSQSLMITEDSAELRHTQCERDQLGRVIITHKPDGNCNYTFFDRQNRLLYEISADGSVKGFIYSRQNSYVEEIAYANKIPASQLQPFPGIVPSIGDLRYLLEPDAVNDRSCYKFSDASGRLKYLVDRENYITEFKYDSLNNLTDKISYHDQLTSDQLQTLLDGGNLGLMPDYTNDRVWQYGYDGNGNKITEIDPADYLTEYRRDAAGRLLEKIVNSQIHSYYYYNAAEQCIAEIDDEGYLTTHSYYASGKIASDIRYAKKPTDGITPIPDPEDQHTSYFYDALGREIKRTLPAAAVKFTHYDSMENKLSCALVDQKDPISERTVLARYDIFDQVTTECPPEVVRLLVAIEKDPSLTPDRKQELITEIWQHRVIKATYADNGLKLTTTDPKGNLTFYYYDINHRLCFTVKPGGRVSETSYNTFSDITAQRQYANLLSADQIAQLTGGFITDTVQQMFTALKDDARDVITQLTLDKRGLVVSKTDPDGYLSQYQYDAFKECVLESKPVADTAPSMTIAHTFEQRGLEITTQTVAGDLAISVSAEYQNPLGKKTKVTDALGNSTNIDYDSLGFPVTVTDANAAIHTLQYDAFGRLVQETNAEQDIVLHQYDQDQRTHIIISCDSDSTPITTSTEQSDIFGQTVAFIDGLGNTKIVAYNADGKVVKQQDEIGRITLDGYDLCDLKEIHQDPANTLTKYYYDAAGNLLQQVFDSTGLALSTEFVYDAFGNKVTRTDPKQISSTQVYDRRGNLLTKILDPDGLSLLTQISYNGQSKAQNLIKGDTVTPVQSTVTQQIDAINRNTGKTVDPDGLALATNKHLDANGNTIAEIDPNGNITRHFYDAVGNKSFTVDPLGGVTGWLYDGDKRVTCERNYLTAIDPSQLSDATTLADIKAAITATLDDKLSYSFYDHAGRVKFSANSLGAVVEKKYDDASREVSNIAYATTVDSTQLSTITTDQLAALIQTSPDDRINYRVLDAAGQERFSIDAAGVVTEQRFDNLGLVITSVIYANPVADPATVAALPPDQVLDQLNLDPVNDHYTYQVFDKNSRPLFTVDSESTVTAYLNDANGNLTQTCVYVDQIVVPATYADLVEQLNQLVPDASKDRITQYQYDSANRQTAVIDALGRSDSYILNALDEILTHTDRAGVDWVDIFDSAKRLTDETTPTGVTKKTYYDSAGNKTQVTFAYGSDDPRTVKLHYNANNKLDSVSIENVTVDGESDPVTVTYSIIYNAKGKKIVTQNEDGVGRFYVYDSEDRLKYEVNGKGAVTQYDRNAFGEVATQTKYATLLTIDLSQYIQTGLTTEIVQQNLQINSSDKIAAIVYDHCGRKLSVKNRAVFYYISDLAAAPVYGTAQPETRYQYNAFGDSIYQGVLVNPVADTWSEQITWYSRTSEVVAVSDPLAYVKCYILNAFGDQTDRVEYATALPQKPTSATTLADLDQELTQIQASTDRSYSSVFDQLGQKTADITHNAVVQQVSYGDGNVPDFADQAAQDITVSYQFSPTQKQIVIIHEDGSAEFTYYDSAGYQIGTAGLLRTCRDANGNEIDLRPLTAFVNNPHGQQLTKTDYKWGATTADASAMPTPYQIDPEDRITTTGYDKRGLMTSQQNAERSTTYSYTAGRKVAKQWFSLTNWSYDGSTFGTTTHTSEQRFYYDALNRTQRQEYWFDDQLEQATASQFDAFGNSAAEGPGDDTWPLYNLYDTMGRSWSSNQQRGKYTLVFYDLSGQQTATMQSATDNLSVVTYDQLQTILDTWGQDITRLERTERQCNLVGQMIANRTPAYSTTDTGAAQDMPLNIVTGAMYADIGNCSISWEHIVETTVTSPTLKIWPKTDSTNIRELPIVDVKGRSGVDVSTLPTDVYSYSIDFYMLDPATGQASTKIQYQSQGVLQFDTGITAQSTALVPMLQPDAHTLFLTGNTSGITGVQLWSNNSQVAEIPVDASLSLDLSGYPSGTYTIKPEIGLDIGAESLPFTIYTATPSPTALGVEIECLTSISTLDTHGQLTWTVPVPFQNLQVKINCRYTDTSDAYHDHTDTITHGAYLGEYTDSNGNRLYCNTEFEYPVKTVTHLKLELNIGTSWVPLLDQDSQQLAAIASTPKAEELDEWEIVPAKDDLEDGWALVDEPGEIVNYTFTDTTTMCLTSITGLSATDTYSFTYLDRSQDRMATWQNLAISYLDAQAGIIAAEVTTMISGSYPYKITDLTVGQDLVSSTFNLCHGSQVFISDNLGPVAPVTLAPTRYYTCDAWGNQITTTDTYGNVTIQTFNYVNKQLTKLQPEVTAVDEHGQSYQVQPLTTYGYDICSRQLAARDPNNHVTAQILNAAGEVISVTVGDGTTDTYGYDALCQQTHHWDPRGKLWVVGYDHLSHKISITSPLGLSQRFTYSEGGQRSSQADGAGNTTRYNVDSRGYITGTYQPLGGLTQTTYDRNKKVIWQQTGDGTLSFGLDYFGDEMQRTGLGGAIYQSQRNYKKQLEQRTSQDGDHGQMIPFNAFADPFYVGDPVATPGQNLTYTYVAGRVTTIVDAAMGTTTTKTYDQEGRLTSITLTQADGTILQSLSTTYDATGRMIWNNDTNAITTIGYDNYGNRRCVTMTINYQNSDGSPGSKTASIWSTYDPADRSIVDRGVLDGQDIVPGDQGMQLAYQDGFRVQQSSKDDGTFDLSYTDDALLSQMASYYSGSDLHENVKKTWQYDDANRLYYYEEGYYLRWQEWEWKFLTTNYARNTYDENSRLPYCEQYQTNDDGNVTKTWLSEFKASGQPGHQQTDYSDVQDHLDISYVGFQGLQQSCIGGTRHDDYGTSDYASALEYYNANAALEAITGSSDGDSNGYIISDEQGHALMKWSVKTSSPYLTRYLYDL